MKQIIMKWKDKRDVVLVSTFHDDSMIDVTTRKRIIQKPYVVLDYNKNKTVDKNDGQLHSYKLAREHLKKYYQKTFRYLLDLVCLNTLIIYKNMGGRISRLDCPVTLAENLSSLGGVVEPASELPKPSELLGCFFPDSQGKAYQEMCSLLGQWRGKSRHIGVVTVKRPYVWYHVSNSYHTDRNLKI
jgi:hypothetical protein